MLGIFNLFDVQSFDVQSFDVQCLIIFMVEFYWNVNLKSSKYVLLIFWFFDKKIWKNQYEGWKYKKMTILIIIVLGSQSPFQKCMNELDCEKTQTHCTPSMDVQDRQSQEEGPRAGPLMRWTCEPRFQPTRTDSLQRSTVEATDRIICQPYVFTSLHLSE
jgi:hypothetical protein